MLYPFDHETLDVYRLAMEVCQWLASVEFPRGWAWLRDRAQRSSGSSVLNIAEGRARGGDAGRNHYRIALGSAAETCVALDIAPVTGVAEQQAKLRRGRDAREDEPVAPIGRSGLPSPSAETEPERRDREPERRDRAPRPRPSAETEHRERDRAAEDEHEAETVIRRRGP